MRATAALLAALLLPAAWADRVISVPMGRKLPYRAIRLEGALEPSRDGYFESYLAYGIGTSWEIEARSRRLRGEDGATTFDLNYNLLAPIPDLAPGISVGVLDALDATGDRRQFFGAVTIRKTLTTLDGDTPGDTTIGFAYGRYLHAMVAQTLPISSGFRFLFEHDGFRLAAGGELSLGRNGAIRAFVRGEQTFVTLRYTVRF